MRASASSRRASRCFGRGRRWRRAGLRGCLRSPARKVSAEALLSLLRRGRTSPARSSSSKSARAASDLVPVRPASRSSTSAWGSPRPMRRRRMASVQAASMARRQRPGTTRRAASGGRPSVHGEGHRVLDVARDGVLRAAQLDDGAFAAGHLDDGGGDGEAADGLGQAVVVGEDDDLAACSRSGGPRRGRRRATGPSTGRGRR